MMEPYTFGITFPFVPPDVLCRIHEVEFRSAGSESGARNRAVDPEGDGGNARAASLPGPWRTVGRGPLKDSGEGSETE